MCGPIAPLIATGIGAVTSGIGTISAINQANAQAAAAQANAAAERDAAQTDQQAMRDAALAQYRQTAQANGRATMQAAADGVATGFGTAAETIADNTMLGHDAVSRIYARGEQALVNRDAAVAGDMTQAAAADTRAQALILGGVSGLAQGLTSFSPVGGPAGRSVLGNASQFAGLKSGMGL